MERTYTGILFILLAFGLAAFLHGAYYCLQVSKTDSWPYVEGFILESYIEKSRSDGKYRYKAKINYSYEINGNKYQGNRVSFGDVVTKGYAEKIIEKYPVGQSVNVYYDPNKSSKSTLVVGLNFIVILYPLLGLFFTILSFVLLVFRKRMLDWSLIAMYTPATWERLR